LRSRNSFEYTVEELFKNREEKTFRKHPSGYLSLRNKNKCLRRKGLVGYRIKNSGSKWLGAAKTFVVPKYFVILYHQNIDSSIDVTGASFIQSSLASDMTWLGYALLGWVRLHVVPHGNRYEDRALQTIENDYILFIIIR
jgi:hypothetical protein